MKTKSTSRRNFLIAASAEAPARSRPSATLRKRAPPPSPPRVPRKATATVSRNTS
jgi:hypothetical protein